MNQIDHIVSHTSKEHLKKYDKHLKKFNATKALDSALDVRPNIVISFYLLVDRV